MDRSYDLIIVGAGPCGLATAIEATKRGLSHLVIEKGSITESLRNYPLRMHFFSTAENIEIGNVPFPTSNVKPSRIEAMQYYRKLAVYFDLNLKLYTEVTGLEQQEGSFKVKTKENRYEAKNVVIATGYFDLPRKLNVPGEELPHVSHYYREPFPYSWTKTVIVGAGNSAIEAALELYRHDVDVTIVHRGNDLKTTAKYWLLPDIRNRIQEGKIKVRFGTTVKAIEPGQMTVQDKKGNTDTLPADFVLALIGYLPDADFLQKARLEVNPDDLTTAFDPETYETSIPGLYLCGTVTAGVHTERVFIENGREHAVRIAEDVAGKVR